MTLMTTGQERLEACAPSDCPICGKSHDYGAEDDDFNPWECLGPRQADADEIHHAAHCCLWKDHDHAARVRIAERVEAGETWADAIEGEPK